ncbi:MAG TPA: DUF3313 domain-containing protein [Stellaceae bacterium]|nr:DUF3313 domain-containing protein [Stellaceae bacterium]
MAGCSHEQGAGPIQQKPSGFQAGDVVGGATAQIKEVKPVSNFLPKPELLQPGGPGRPALVYFNSQMNPGNYHKIFIDPVAIWAAPGSDFAKIPSNDQRALANLFYSDLYNALKGSCTLVKAASPNTIHFKIALVDAKEPNAAINTVATYTPYVSTAYKVSARLLHHGVGRFAGTATVEAYAVDAVSGDLLWEAVDKRGGTTALAANTLDSTRDIRHAFEAWGVQMRTRLQEIGVCRK